MKRIKQQTNGIKSSTKKVKSNENVDDKSPLQVFCRIRPLQNENEATCISVEPPNSILLTLTDSNRAGVQKQLRCTFKQVFDENTTQEQMFNSTCLQLVQNLIAGKNGLLFTYGISNSGKSYTMNGMPDDFGLMPRSLDVLFKSIKRFQTTKFMFKPDRLNGFDVQSEPDALLERQRELISSMKNPKSAKKKEPTADMMRGRSSTQKLDVNEHNMYAVFINFIEIYNNSVYDLLEDHQSEDCLRVRPLQPKIIREDGARNMYVHGVDEVEVTTPEEALEIFYRGQKRRRLAHTALNTESSRSHSVFTIRLVQAPLDIAGDRVIDEKKSLSISQLSLVDLAGSERTARAKTQGQRLREAGSINNSLMTLRSCFELLRENQQSGTNKMIPYRESRLTHLFKKYFDGEGDVRMIICINPRADDCEECNHVLKFAELSQEVKVNRARPAPIVGPTTVKRKLCQPAPSEGTKRSDELLIPETNNSQLNSSFLMNCRFQTAFPQYDSAHPETAEGYISETLQVVQARMEKKKELQSYLKSHASAFRSNLESLLGELSSAHEEVKKLTESSRRKDQAIDELEKKLHEMDSEKHDLKMKFTSTEAFLRNRENELANKRQQLTKEQAEREKEKLRMEDKIAQKTDKLTKELQRQKSQMEMEMWQRNRRLRKVKKILDSGPVVPSSSSCFNSPYPVPCTPKSSSETDGTKATEPLRLRNRQMPPSKTPSKYTENVLDLATPASAQSRERNVVASNPRMYRRSRSAGPGDVWLDHRPPSIPADTILQPKMKKFHPVSKLTDIKDVNKSSKYCLTVLDKDSDGDIETCLYKGDVLPTPSGGAQVTFNDVEILKQKSPINSPPRKRVSGNAIPHEDLENRCGMSVECHGKRSRH